MLFTLESVNVGFSSLIAAAMSKLENSFLRNASTLVREVIVVDYKITVFTKNVKLQANKVQGAKRLILRHFLLSKNNIFSKDQIHMTPVVQLYWLRVVLGIVAGAITALLAALFGSAIDITTLVNSVTVALLIYFVTYYIIRGFYKNKIEKQSKILTTAIGMYFFSWLAFFVLFYTVYLVALGRA
jgi:hypothetical protein